MDNDVPIFPEFKYTPCSELEYLTEERRCQSPNGCTVSNFQSEICLQYAQKYPERIYQCVSQGIGVHSFPILHYHPFQRYFSQIVDTCAEAHSGKSVQEIIDEILEKLN